MEQRPHTPPKGPPRAEVPKTPEQVRRTEEQRLKAKARRATENSRDTLRETTTSRLGPLEPTIGQKRAFTSTASDTNANQDRQDAQATEHGASKNGIYVARKFMNYVEYDFSKMTDTKGGFLAVDDDLSRNEAPSERPSHMSEKEWERHQLLKKLREQKSGPFEPGILPTQEKCCAECGTLEIDWKWEETFGVRVCNACKEKHPEKYSLLTKSEARDDYLLTDPELKDEELLPRLERPNPHKSTWHNMQLYLRCQVEAYAFSDRKWGSAERMDEEFERREKEKKRRKEEKFKSKLVDLKKRTRVEAYKRGKTQSAKSNPAQFGDDLRKEGDKHEHLWGRALADSEGTMVKRCIDCGLEVEELDFG